MKRLLLRSCWIVVLVSSLCAQGTREDYARAERFLPGRGAPELSQVSPNWLEKQDRFWYRRATPEGREFILVDAKTGERKPLFDHQKLAGALSRATGRPYSPKRPPFQALELVDNERAVRVEIEGQVWTCQLTSYECRSGGASG